MAKKHSSSRIRSAMTSPSLARAAAVKSTTITYNHLQRALIAKALNPEALSHGTITRNYSRAVIDRRRWHPERVKPPGAVKRLHSRLIDAHPFGTGFAVPKRIATCARRKVRREVIFANKLRRKGSGKKRRNRNYWSDVKC